MNCSALCGSDMFLLYQTITPLINLLNTLFFLAQDLQVQKTAVFQFSWPSSKQIPKVSHNVFLCLCFHGILKNIKEAEVIYLGGGNSPHAGTLYVFIEEAFKFKLFFSNNFSMIRLSNRAFGCFL